MEKMSEGKKKFPFIFWLVIVFEFFERGSYYGVMSILSVYLTDKLGFAKESVGIIKGTIQPLLYFLPILAGAIADRFGYRRTLMVAFALLGTGYFLTSTATTYTWVFIFLVIMGLGAGTFKPIISSSIARTTDKSNSALGFGIYYWSINLGAFLFPLILVPFLKANFSWSTVLIAAAIGTGAMLIPTLFMYREPPKPEAKKTANLIQTLADAFEIIYSPLILIYRACGTKKGLRMIASILFLAFLGYGIFSYVRPRETSLAAPGMTFPEGDVILDLHIDRNQSIPDDYEVSLTEGAGSRTVLTTVLYHPDRLDAYQNDLLAELKKEGLPESLTTDDLADMVTRAQKSPFLQLTEASDSTPFAVTPDPETNSIIISVKDPEAYSTYKDSLLDTLRRDSRLLTLPDGTLDTLFTRGQKRPFLLLFVGILLLFALIILGLEPRYKASMRGKRPIFILLILFAAMGMLWGLPALSLFARIVCTVIFTTVLSIFLMDFQDITRYRDHWHFLLLVFLYSGFWILYFQMFDSVLWYVQAYVNAESLNNAVNALINNMLGIHYTWRFDVEHVTVMNAGTIILLQLIISNIVKNKKALPTMIFGILLGTIGMAILAVSTGIWVFLAGITIFSIGEMTAHPKFISYVGQTAPKDRVATYMGYIFLYGVIGSSIGAVVGANLYVKFVDNMNQPRVLWIIFSMIGVATIVALLLYNKFLAVHEED
mgnify:CR=1 FL=1